MAALLVLCVASAAGALVAMAGPRHEGSGGSAPLDFARIRAADEKIDPNTATAASLLRLPRLGPARTEAILRYRHTHGPGAFRRATDLQQVRGIGPATLEQLLPHLFFPPADVSH